MNFNSASLEPPARRARDWRSILQAVLSFLLALVLVGQGFFLLLMGWFGTSSLEMIAPTQGVLQIFGFIQIVMGLLVIPSGLTAVYRLKEKTLPAWLRFDSNRKRRLLNLSLVLLPIVLVLGVLLDGIQAIQGFILPLAGVVGILLPVLWLVSFGQQDLRGGSAQRKWGLLGVSLTFTTFVIIIVELLAVVLGIVVIGIWVAANPQMAEAITDFANRIMLSGGDMEAILQDMESYLRQPLVIILVLVAVSVIAPLIEEALKTLGVWLFVRRKLTPAEGYVAGLICGAGFTLVEGMLSLTNVTGPQDWLGLVIGRAGGSLLHIFTGGIIGWGLANAWSTRKVSKYLLSFVSALFIHGLWNALAVGAAILPMFIFPDTEPGGWVAFLFYLPTILLGLAVLVLFILFTLRLRKQARVSDEVPPPV